METFDSTYKEYLIELEQIDLFDRAYALNLQRKSDEILLAGSLIKFQGT